MAVDNLHPFTPPPSSPPHARRRSTGGQQQLQGPKPHPHPHALPHPKQTKAQTRAQMPQPGDTIPTLPRLACALPAWIRGPALHPHEAHSTCNGPASAAGGLESLGACLRMPSITALLISISTSRLLQLADPVNAGALRMFIPQSANLTCLSLMPAHPSPSGAASQSPSAQHQTLQSHSPIALSASSVACFPALPCISAYTLRVSPAEAHGCQLFEGLTGIPPRRHWTMSLVASDSVQRSRVSCYLESNVSGPSSGPSVTVHRLTMHIITLGDATMVLSRMFVSTFDIKGSPSQHPMSPLLDHGHWPVAAGHLGHPNYRFSQ